MDLLKTVIRRVVTESLQPTKERIEILEAKPDSSNTVEQRLAALEARPSASSAGARLAALEARPVPPQIENLSQRLAALEAREVLTVKEKALLTKLANLFVEIEEDITNAEILPIREVRNG